MLDEGFHIMIRKLCTITLLMTVLLISFGTTNADLGQPSILAVAEVYLKNGGKLEGVIWFKRGGYVTEVYYSGFCFKKKDESYQLQIIDRDFFKFPPPDYHHLKSQPERVYYAENIRKVEHNISISKPEQILKVTKTFSYKLLDEIVIYKELPLNLYALDKEKNNKVVIKMDEVKQFKLPWQPSIKWLNKIKKHKMDFDKKMQEDEKAGINWVDYQSVKWHHEMPYVQKRLP